MSQVSQAHKLQTIRGTLAFKGLPHTWPTQPQKQIQSFVSASQRNHCQAHTAPVGCRVTGFLFRRLWSKNRAPQAQGKWTHTDCVHVLSKLPSEDYLKHKASKPLSKREAKKGKQAGYVFNIQNVPKKNVYTF